MVSPELHNAFRMVSYEFLLFAGIFLVNQASLYLSMIIAGRLRIGMTSDILERLSGCNMSHFDDPCFYDTASRAMAESGTRPLDVVNSLTGFISQVITFCSMASLLLAFSWPLVPSMVLLTLPYLVVRTTYGRKMYRIQYDRTQDARMSGFLSGCMLDRRYIPEVCSFMLWDYLRAEWLRYAERFFRQDLRIGRRNSLVLGGVGLTQDLCKVAVACYILYRGATSRPPLSVGAIMMYIGAFRGGLGTVGRTMDTLAGLYVNMLYLKNMLDFRKSTPAQQSRTGLLEAPRNIESICIDNVSFRYPDQDHFALRHLNITLTMGDTCLILGANGAGKTTLIKLLTRLYEPTEGRILINDEDIRRYDLESLRERITVIFQEYLCYPFSVAQNIGVGSVENMDNMQRIVAAAQAARVDHLINSLPEGYDTILTRQYRDGVDLSRGQWQRICLARMFMKNAPILLFDEPTASLDIESEANLLREIAELGTNRLCILISHRILRSDLASRILVMESGSIVEEGDHTHLLCRGGTYARLWHIYHTLDEVSSGRVR